MSIFLLATAFFAQPVAPRTDRIFSCSLGAKHVEITGIGDRLTYRFGRPGKPEITLIGGPRLGTYYHRSTYVRGEDQTLRFVTQGYDYIVFNRWVAPYELSTGEIPPKISKSGLLVKKDGKLIRRLDCVKGGDLHEWPVFKRLPQDEDNVIPDDVG